MTFSSSVLLTLSPLSGSFSLADVKSLTINGTTFPIMQGRGGCVGGAKGSIYNRLAHTHVSQMT